MLKGWYNVSVDRKQNKFIINTVIPYCVEQGLDKHIAYAFYSRFYSDPIAQVKSLENTKLYSDKIKSDFKLMLECLINVDNNNPLVKEWKKALKLSILNI